MLKFPDSNTRPLGYESLSLKIYCFIFPCIHLTMHAIKGPYSPELPPYPFEMLMKPFTTCQCAHSDVKLERENAS